MKRLSIMALFIGVALAVTFLLERVGFQQTSSEENSWPHDQITIVTPFDAGGSVDTMARGIAENLQREMGIRINVLNYPGARHSSERCNF